MKKIILTLVAIIFIASLLAGCQMETASQPSAAATQAISSSVASPAPQTNNVDNRSKLSVTTTETVKILPDIATVTLGVSTRGKTAEETQKANSAIANAVVAAVKALGIKDEDIQTSNINLYQEYSENTAEERQYNMQVDYTVKVTPIENVGKVIDAAIKAGANVTYSLYFDVQDRDAAYMQALEKAMKSVSDKAQKMALAGGLTIDRVLDVQEAGQGGGFYPMAASYAKAEGAAADMVNVSPGTIEISATVSATYLLK